MESLSKITYRAVNKSRGVAEKVAVLTVAFAILAIIISMSVASGFRQELTSVILNNEGDYWLEYRDSSLSAPCAQKIDSDLVEDILSAGASRVEARLSSAAIVLSEEGPIPLEVRSSEQIKSSGLSISTQLASKLAVEQGDTIYIMYSLKLPFSFPVTVDSLFKCSIPQISESICYGSFKTVESYKGISPGLADGYVVWGGDVEPISDQIYSRPIWMYDAQDRFSGIFEWLDVIDGNVWLVVIIMIIVAVINMLAASLSMILENTKTIAILKTMGMPISKIRYGIMLRNLLTSARGAFIGFFIAIVFCSIQYYFRIIHLPAADYMVDSVPISMNIPIDILATVLSIVIISLITLFVTSVIDRIKEDKIIRYE